MKAELQYIGNKIMDNNYTLAENLAMIQDSNYRDTVENTDVSYNQLQEWRAELIHYLGMALYEFSDSLNVQINQWAEKTGDFSIRNHIPLTDTLRALTFYRTVIWDVFTEELELMKFSAITMLDVSKIIDPLLDNVANIFGALHERHSNHLMKLAYSALEELSVPVVPIDEGIAVIPIIGEIDTRRAKLIMDSSLQESYNLQLDYLILDVSGVLMIDTMVAENIFQIVNALQLTGVKAILTGIRPEIAQTIVKMGIPFETLNIRANLRQALNELRSYSNHQR